MGLTARQLREQFGELEPMERCKHGNAHARCSTCEAERQARAALAQQEVSFAYFDQVMAEEERYSRPATMSEAHAEWHRNAGVPMGQPGCPQDACHPPEEYPSHEVTTSYGTLSCYSFAEAKEVAREAAKATGKVCKVVALA